MTLINRKTGKVIKRSTGPFGVNTIYSPEGEAYMTRLWLGRLRLHIFHTGDLDQDHHDHPWDFWTFPLVPYVEEGVYPVGAAINADGKMIDGSTKYGTFRQIVPAWRWSYRPATHCHRVLGKQAPDSNWPIPVPGKIVTIIWRGKEGRQWGFLKHRDGRWCWQHWKDYVMNGGKDTPCQ